MTGDRDLLFEAVANLVDNAVKFTPAGGSVRISLRRGADGPIIRVADTGPGIAEAEREAVTRRFYRGDKSRGTKGVGLGLSLVAAIVKRHGFSLLIGGGVGGNLAEGPGCVVDIVCRDAWPTLSRDAGGRDVGVRDLAAREVASNDVAPGPAPAPRVAAQ